MQFNPNDYATVDERHRAARKDNPTMVVETIMLNSIDCPASEPIRWVFHCKLYRSPEDRKNGLLWSTGTACEIDMQGGVANNVAACENTETSALGRALANAGYSGNKRASREEMENVQRREVAERELLKSIAETTDKDALTKLWNHAAGNGLARSESVSEAFRQRGEALKA